jgi:squalene-hopene/tetraprenyl-beta-curcumene cyclase
MAAGHAHSPQVAAGIRYLVGQQRDDGTWHETQYTGTGFPLVFYLRYHYYPIYFPLLALAQWSAVAPRDAVAATAPISSLASQTGALALDS